MTKDEMKDRISMALKDPVLQQGFEIICKENAELKARLNAINLLTPELEKQPKVKKQQLAKAKDLLLKFIELKNKPCAVGHSVNMLLYENIRSEAEQFLRDNDIDNAIQQANQGLDFDRIADEMVQDLNKTE